MKIVVLDGHTLNPGDLSWQGIEAMGELKVYERTAPEDVEKRAGDAEIVFTNKTPLNRETIRHLTKLKYIGVLATGYNVVNVEAARKRGIVVTNVPGYGTASVAQHAFALLLELTQQVGHHAFTVRKGRWSRTPDFCYWLHPLVELDGLTMGVVGYGKIGQAVARIALGFGMKVVVTDQKLPPTLPAGITAASLEDVLSKSDVISLHCPLTPETEKLVNEASIARMKKGVLLLNTSRGGLVDEAALIAGLESGQIGGAGLDVISVEPPPADHPLLKARNCIVTPHMAWATRAARARLMDIVVDNLRAFLAGEPRNVVG
jgi:glycerate dehydrogenase